jgi:ATP-binding cassette subfamily B multidrug efflux pump
MLMYFKWFAHFWRQHRIKMFLVLLLTVLTIVVKTIFPILLKYIIDAMEGDFQVDSVLTLLWIYLAVGILQELLSRGLPLFRAVLNLTFSAIIRQTYYKLFTQKTPAFFQKYQTGDLLTRLTDDIDGQWDRIEWYSCSGVLRPIEASLILIFSLSVMFYYSWTLTLFSFLPLPFLVLILIKAQDKMVHYARAKQTAISDCNNHLETCFSGIRIVKSTLSEEEQLKKYQEVLANRVQREKDFLKMNQFVHFFSMLVNHTGKIIVLFIGGYLAIHKKLELGTFILFISYLDRLIEPIWTLSWFYASSKQVFSYVDRLKETESFQNFDEIYEKHKNLTPSQGALTYFEELRIEDLTFRYHENTQEPLLDKISFRIKAGEVVALVGSVGSGKTTLLEILMGNLSPQGGKLRLNGLTYESIPLETRNAFFGYVEQQSTLFSDTILNNIFLGNSFSEEALQKAIHTAQLTEELNAFPQGLETPLGQRGITLSGGQKQRLSLARTLARNPAILLLDDCTSAMDAATESRFWEAFRKNYPETACLVITHRAATANQAHRIYHLEQGQFTRLKHWQDEAQQKA